MNKVITFCDRRYFQYGTMLLNTRHVINADFVCYAPDLSSEQIDVLEKHDIRHKHIPLHNFAGCMQMQKFYLAIGNMTVGNMYNNLITFVDWDTFFINDWGNEIAEDMALGITYRESYIKNKCLRAYSNGGVIFFRDNKESLDMCQNAIETINAGENEDLPEYDEIWKTLEEGRAPHKTHYRTNHRWWVDQVFLSALVYRCLKGQYNGSKLEDMQLTWHGNKIRFYNCHNFNRVESEPTLSHEHNLYIKHLKSKSGASGKLKDGK